MEHATEKRKRRIPLFLQAVLITLGSYLVYQYGIRPPIPASILFMFMVVTVSAVLLYVSLDNESLEEFLRPILTVIRDDRWKIVRWAFMIAIPLVAGYIVYDKTVPKIEPPITVRSVHPAPPGSINVRGKTYDLRTLENPLRKDTANLAKHVKAGGGRLHRKLLLLPRRLSRRQGTPTPTSSTRLRPTSRTWERSPCSRNRSYSGGS